MRILAIDPGTTKSAWVEGDGESVSGGILENFDLVQMLEHFRPGTFDVVVIEEMECYGMAVGKEVFRTVHWSGRFYQASTSPVEQLPRKEVKIALCGSMRAKDPNIRQALIDMYGGSKEKAIGLKKTPGPLYGFKADMWAALGVLEAYKQRVAS